MKDCKQCCIGCGFYPTAKDRKQCETYKERAKETRHRVYMMKKTIKELEEVGL